ncbi:MAG: hypothetical protein ACW99Q_23380 [Candidatus Kariarchaeaceae archaeon]|jgi:hypothetical protein
MKFLKKFSKKTPHQKIIEEIREKPINQPSILFTDLFPKTDVNVIIEAINELIKTKEIDGKFIGNKSWFLFEASEKLETVWDQLLSGSIDLNKISEQWGNFGNKRVYMALEEFASMKKIQAPIFTRKGNNLLLHSFILQEWRDAANKFDIDETDISFNKIIEQINSKYREMAIEIIKESTKKDNSELLIGSDDIVRRRSGILIHIADYINLTLINSNDALTYQNISEKLGLSEEEVSNMILQLIEGKSIENITNYPVDGIIKKR